MEERNPFAVTDMSFDEYGNQEIIDTGDGEFFDALDEGFGIIPRTDKIDPNWEPPNDAVSE